MKKTIFDDSLSPNILSNFGGNSSILPWEVVEEESSCHVLNGMVGCSGPVKRFWAVWTSSTSCYTKIIEPLIVHFIFNDSGK